ncbi:MAG: hypothetical protein APF76_04815 [Desulfitibacter sp. BRH_c19]|nr:MAG: hypothetical protein APF76_04815 [Desulfitibacter sp. BRH_c19]
MGPKNKDEVFNKALGGEISTYIQPIINLQANSIEGWEMLTRGPLGTTLEMPSRLFSYARRKKKMRQLEYQCLNNSLMATQMLNSKSKVFINISSLIFCEKLDMITNYAADLNNCSIVLEITESHKSNISRVIDAANWYKSKGISIAVDDVSSGYDRLKNILYVKPEYFKLERDLIMDCHKNIDKRIMIKSLLLMGNKLGSRVIAEGVETKYEVNILRSLGVKLCQGYYFSKPFPAVTLKDITTANII